MCLIVIAAGMHPELPLVVAANRDEYHRRPCVPAGPWRRTPEILAGRDLEAGGTWLGVTLSGRFAAVTNFREPGQQVDSAPSRGALVARYLASSEGPAAYLEKLRPRMDQLNGFNLLVGDRDELLWCSNRDQEPRRPRQLKHAIHGLSNHLLDTPWPKVERTRRRLAELLDAGRPNPTEVLGILDDRVPAANGDMPDTGIGPVWERLLSAPRIVHPQYGTRCSTAVLFHRDGGIELVERGFDREGCIAWQRAFEIERPSADETQAPCDGARDKAHDKARDSDSADGARWVEV